MAIGTDIDDGAIERSAGGFLFDSIAGVGESPFDDAGSTPCGDVLGWSSSSFNVRGSGRYVNLHQSSIRK